VRGAGTGTGRGTGTGTGTGTGGRSLRKSFDEAKYLAGDLDPLAIASENVRALLE
jgi:hypothetical protein